MGGGEIDIFLGGLIAAQIFSVGYNSESRNRFFPDHEASPADDIMLGIALFHLGGVLSGLLNALARIPNKRVSAAADLSRQLTQWCALFVWLGGNMAIGYISPPTSANGLNLIPTPELSSKMQRDRFLTLICIDFAGGFFYWGTLGMGLRLLKGAGEGPREGVLAHIVAPPIFALLVNACYHAGLEERGGYLYLYRIICIVAAVMIGVRALLMSPEFPDEVPSAAVAPADEQAERLVPSTERPSLLTLRAWRGAFYKPIMRSIRPHDREEGEEEDAGSAWSRKTLRSDLRWSMWHMIGVVCLAPAIYAPFAVIPPLVGGAAGWLHRFFGGVAIGSALGGALTAYNVRETAWGGLGDGIFLIFTRIHDALALGTAGAVLGMQLVWPTHGVELLAYGGCAGFLFSWLLFQATRKQDNVAVVLWVWLYSIAASVGCCISLFLLDWSAGPPLAVVVMSGVGVLVMLFQIALTLCGRVV